MWELGNLFGDTDNNLVNLISRNIMNEDTVASVTKAVTITMENMKQYEDFVVKGLITYGLTLFREKSESFLYKTLDESSIIEEKDLYASLCVAYQLLESNFGSLLHFCHVNQYKS